MFVWIFCSFHRRFQKEKTHTPCFLKLQKTRFGSSDMFCNPLLKKSNPKAAARHSLPKNHHMVKF